VVIGARVQTAFFDKFADSGTQDFLGDAYCVKVGKSTVQKWVVKVLILQAGIGGRGAGSRRKRARHVARAMKGARETGRASALREASDAAKSHGRPAATNGLDAFDRTVAMNPGSARRVRMIR